MNDARLDLTLPEDLKARAVKAAGAQGRSLSNFTVAALVTRVQDVEAFVARRELGVRRLAHDQGEGPDPDVSPCESCGEPSVGLTSDDVALCERCGKALEEADASSPTPVQPGSFADGGER